eukprot:3893217-Rhodomonas_salina.1
MDDDWAANCGSFQDLAAKMNENASLIARILTNIQLAKTLYRREQERVDNSEAVNKKQHGTKKTDTCCFSSSSFASAAASIHGQIKQVRLPAITHMQDEDCRRNRGLCEIKAKRLTSPATKPLRKGLTWVI